MPEKSPIDLPPHRMKVALISPQIAPNTGNIARACVATGTALHLVRPLGFVLSDRNLKRSAMDYWPRLKLTVHDDIDAFFVAVAGQNVQQDHARRDNARVGDARLDEARLDESRRDDAQLGKPWFFSSKGKRSLWDAEFVDGDWLIFGSETKGIDDHILEANADRSIRIPQAPGERCLNLSTAVGIGLYESLRKILFSHAL
jgi:tRNA (cytidine/uridine-2'-O-)-methyltransferase